MLIPRKGYVAFISKLLVNDATNIHIMKQYHRKPAGTLNLYKVSMKKIEHIPNSFPDTKNQQEIEIVKLFLNIASNNKILEYKKYEHNKEQDLDFTIISDKGKSLLELTELMPSDNMKGGYNSISSEVNQQALVDRLIKIIEKKSQKYIGIKMPIDLLVYITNDNSNPSTGAERYLKNYFNTNKHAFRNIFFFVPMLSIKDGIIIQYYPNNEDGKDIKPLGITLNFKPE